MFSRSPGLYESGKPSRVLEISWGYSLEKNNYIKCSQCNFLANSLTEMMQHYTICKQVINVPFYSNRSHGPLNLSRLSLEWCTTVRLTFEKLLD